MPHLHRLPFLFILELNRYTFAQWACSCESTSAKPLIDATLVKMVLAGQNPYGILWPVVFHTNCALKWFRIVSTCVCRQLILRCCWECVPLLGSAANELVTPFCPYAVFGLKFLQGKLCTTLILRRVILTHIDCSSETQY